MQLHLRVPILHTVMNGPMKSLVRFPRRSLMCSIEVHKTCYSMVYVIRTREQCESSSFLGTGLAMINDVF